MTATAARMPIAMRSARESAVRVSLAGVTRALSRRCVKELLDVLPVYQMVDEGLQVVRPAVAVIDVVGMFPHVAAENGRCAVHQRILAVGRLGDGELAVLDSDPAPARAELGHAGLHEILLHLGEAAKIAVDPGLELAGDLVAAAVRLHPFPEMDVVVMLTGIVEEARILPERALDHLLERLALEPAAREQLVAVVDIGL